MTINISMTDQLVQFLPLGSIQFIQKWINNYSLTINICNPRKTKLGDYRSIPVRRVHQITINNDLSKELFLLTLTHEIAHMHAFVRYGMRIKPHGLEWKKIFQTLIIQTFPFYKEATQKELALYAKDPKATLGGHPNLSKLLMNFNKDEGCFLDELEDGALFVINQKILKKGNLRRTRYICEEYQSKRRYLVNKAAQVKKYKRVDEE